MIKPQTQSFRSAVCVTVGGFALLASPGASTALDRARQPVAFGQKITKGQAYVTLVRLEHQSDTAQNGCILIAFEENGLAGIPIFESEDDGASWHFLVDGWNTNNGLGPWCETAAPVQKLMNGVLALMLKHDGTMLHITSSANPEALNNPSKDEILFAAKKLNFNRFEAEDAARQGSAVMRDASVSNGAKARLRAKDIGRLRFHVHVWRPGSYTLTVNYEDIGFPAVPRLIAKGATLQGTTAAARLVKNRLLFGPAILEPGEAAPR